MKNTRIILILILTMSLIINAVQIYKWIDYRTQERFYTERLQQGFYDLEQSFDLYDGTGALSNESAIKNSLSIVENLRCFQAVSSYKSNRYITLMLMNLSKFFVMNSNQYINENIGKIRLQLMVISKDLNDEKSIDDFNVVLEKMIENEIVK